MTEETARGLSLGSKILIGVLSGIACGVFLGELSAPFALLGDVYVGLLQMTVLPYVTVSLIAKIGGLTYQQARRLAGRAGVVLLALWGVTLVVVVALPLSFPAWEAGTFFSASLVERPEKLDFLGLYLPINPFHSLANNVVPAAVLFSICVGVALIAVPEKRRLLDPLEIVTESLSRIANFVVRLSPWGTFALAAGAAGTLSAGPVPADRLLEHLHPGGPAPDSRSAAHVRRQPDPLRLRAGAERLPRGAAHRLRHRQALRRAADGDLRSQGGAGGPGGAGGGGGRRRPAFSSPSPTPFRTPARSPACSSSPSPPGSSATPSMAATTGAFSASACSPSSAVRWPPSRSCSTWSGSRPISSPSSWSPASGVRGWATFSGPCTWAPSPW